MINLKVSIVFVVFVVAVLLTESVHGKTQVSRVRRRRNNNLSIVDFIRRSMRKYGEENVTAAFGALDEKDITQVVQILIGQTDKQVADDILAMQMYAAQQDPTLVKIIKHVYAGQSVPPKAMFEMDDKLKIYPWWRRLRGKVLTNTDKYIAIYINTRSANNKNTTAATNTAPKQ